VLTLKERFTPRSGNGSDPVLTAFFIDDLLFDPSFRVPSASPEDEPEVRRQISRRAGPACRFQAARD
jgi:hypothetical protein